LVSFGQQQIKRCHDESDIVFLVDSSKSVGKNNFDNIERIWVGDMIQSLLTDKDRAALIRFSERENTKMFLSLGQSASMTKSEMESVANNLEFYVGWTSTRTALDLAIEELTTNSVDRNRMIILLTDGKPHPPKEQYVCPETDLSYPDPGYQSKLNEEQISVFVVGVGNEYLENKYQLECLVDYDDNHMVDVVDFENGDITQIIDEILSNRACSESPTVKPTRSPTLKPTPAPTGCTRESNADVIYLVDGSKSVTPYGFAAEKQWIVDFLAEVMPDESNRIGLVQYSTTVKTVLSLEQSEALSLSNVQSVVSSLVYQPGHTHIKEALNIVVDMFKQQSTDPSREKVLIMLSDGHPYPNYDNKFDEDICPPYGYWDGLSYLVDEGVYTAVIGVGPEKEEWMPHISCLFQHPRSISLMIEDYDVLRAKESAAALVDIVGCGGDVEVTASPIPSPTHSPVVPCRAKLIDLVFLLDSSGSLGQPNFELQKEYAKVIMNNLATDSSLVSFVRFETTATLELALLDSDGFSEQQRESALDSIPFKAGWTATREAIDIGLDQFEDGDQSRKRVMFLMTDGRPYREENQYVCPTEPGYTDFKYRERMDANNIDLVIIGVGSQWKDEKSKVSCLTDEELMIDVDQYTQDGAFETLADVLDVLDC
jgi:Mg-chelatase subunit ChlD